jgi:hypothetical protein
MADVDNILKKLGLLGVEDTKRVAKAVREHLEELDEIAAYDEAKAKKEQSESLDTVLRRYSKPKRA